MLQCIAKSCLVLSYQGIQMEEPMSIEWTNEKHSLYLNSMEASFVKQLYNHEYNAMDMLGWRSRRRNQHNSSSSGQSNANVGTSGHGINTRAFMKHPRNQHCSPVENLQEVTSANLSGALYGAAINLGRQATNSNQSLSPQSNPCQSSCYEEMSGQNFMDEGNQPVQIINHPNRKKRMKTSITNARSKDQVVPIAKSPIPVKPDILFK
ncbi:hypothetical protein FRX31_003156 [Thalictrum thalictroides]|uniref:Uncharacterized protein n=1 Tax=Thalictrum thalictroides TaxID=46969 RepID=A0A7J6XE18_THATH|nr:hypothetical protein FRX31_003156 [Thalictrum thalictroides]